MLSRLAARRELVYLEKRALLLNAPSVLQRQHFSSNDDSSAPRRRLRRLKPVRSRWDTEFKMPDTGGLREAFEPDEENIADYLKKASLSPWVPTPDPVARRVLDLLNANEDDVSLYYCYSVMTQISLFSMVHFLYCILATIDSRGLGLWRRKNEFSCQVSKHRTLPFFANMFRPKYPHCLSPRIYVSSYVIVVTHLMV